MHYNHFVECLLTNFSQGNLRPLLEASITTEKTEQLFALLKQRSQNSELKNLWLMSPLVRYLFLHGHFEIIKSPFIEMEGRIMEKGVSLS